VGIIAVIAIIFLLNGGNGQGDNGADGTPNGESTTPVEPFNGGNPHPPDTAAQQSNNPTPDGSVNGGNVRRDPVVTPYAGKMPYKRGVAYRVYRFPFDVSDYGYPDPELNKLASVLMAYPDLKIQIYAYTDSRGERMYNQELSDRRAESIYNYLVLQGIDGNRIAYKGRGVSYLYRYHKNNRRADFILKK
jgi:outer membrane protein OmpA-like peptidoglycan-associated protein